MFWKGDVGSRKEMQLQEREVGYRKEMLPVEWGFGNGKEMQETKTDLDTTRNSQLRGGVGSGKMLPQSALN